MKMEMEIKEREGEEQGSDSNNWIGLLRDRKKGHLV